MKKFTSETQKIGEIGENVACKYLENKGFSVLERNFTRKWGEIDIVAEKIVEKSKKLYFIEVKSLSVSRETLLRVSHETNDGYRPEDNMHPQKIQRLSRIIQTYLIEKGTDDQDWQFDVHCVFLDVVNKKAKVKVIPNVIL